MRFSDWSSDVCSSDLKDLERERGGDEQRGAPKCGQYRLADLAGEGRILGQLHVALGKRRLIAGGNIAIHPFSRVQQRPRLAELIWAQHARDMQHHGGAIPGGRRGRSEEHTSELQSLMRISYAVFCLKKKKNNNL